MSRVRHPLARLVAGAALISFAPVLVKLAPVGPTPAAFYRLAIGGAVLAAIVALRSRTTWWGGRHYVWLSAGAGALLALDLALWHRSINLIGPGLATILANLQVFFLAAVGVLVYRERFTLRLALGIPLAMVGLLMVFGPEWRTVGAGYRLGVVFGVLTAVSYAGYLLTLRRAQTLAPSADATATVAMLSLLGAVVLAGAVWLEGDTFRVPTVTGIGILVAYALVAQVFAWVLISTALPSVEASRAGLVLLLQPALAYTWDLVLFGRRTTVVEVTGAVVTLAAIYVGSAMRRRTRTAAAPPE